MPNRYVTRASMLFLLLSSPVTAYGQVLEPGKAVRITEAVEVLPSGELAESRGSFQGRLVSVEGGVVELSVEGDRTGEHRSFALGGRSEVAVGRRRNRAREVSILGGLLGFAIGFHRATASEDYRDGWIFTAEDQMVMDGISGGAGGLLVGAIAGAIIGTALSDTEWVSLRQNEVGFHIR